MADVNGLSVQTVLAPLCEEMKEEADALLDLWEGLRRQRYPGRCIGCYFRLFARAGATTRARLTRLREWLEEHVEIVACDENQEELERLPIILEGDDLETYCRDVMQEFVDNRAYAGRRISLTFDFKQVAA